MICFMIHEHVCEETPHTCMTKIERMRLYTCPKRVTVKDSQKKKIKEKLI